MTPSDLAAVIRVRWKVITAITLAVLLVSLVLTLVTPKTYASSANLYITSQGGGQNDASTAYQGGLLSQERVKSYTELISSVRLAEDVRGRLNLPEPAEDIAKEISATATVDTVLITITVQSRDPVRSSDIANAASASFVDLVSELEAPLNRAQPPAVAARPVQRATPDSKPVSPSYPVNLALGLLVGLVLGVVGGLIAHRLDTSVKRGEQAVEITGAAVIGNIPVDPGIEDDRLPIVNRPRSGIAEAFRQVRTNLKYADIHDGGMSLVVTSSAPGEGKSTCACNLALALATAGSRVILVEADLRRPRVATYLELEAKVGLSTVLSRQIRLEEAIQSWRHGLRVLTSGELPHNPSELLGTPRMSEVLAQLREQYDVVILDCPPLRAVTDAAVLTPMTDGALVVCRGGRTPARDLALSVGDLGQVSARIVGTIMVGGVVGRRSAPTSYYDYSSDDGVVADGPAAPAFPLVLPTPGPRALARHQAPPPPSGTGQPPVEGAPSSGGLDAETAAVPRTPTPFPRAHERSQSR